MGDKEQARATRVLVVAGTHGNERNGVQLLERWRQSPTGLDPTIQDPMGQGPGGLDPAGQDPAGLDPAGLDRAGLELVFTPGNPAAIAAGRRYIERDLNRSFLPELLADPAHQELEVRRARDLLAAWGPQGAHPCAVALDLHSTTAAMGNSLVVYGRRPADLALAAGLQGRLGLPVYLHEKDWVERGYLVEQWPCGLVIEVGPVPQGVVNATICRQTQLALDCALALLAEARQGAVRLPRELVVHKHLRSLDRPRDAEGKACAMVHPHRQDRDWQPLRPGDPLFQAADGSTLGWEPAPGEPSTVWPVFINEAAYEEKGIALSLTERQVWTVPAGWGEALIALAGGA